jgi:hypothetical protein
MKRLLWLLCSITIFGCTSTVNSTEHVVIEENRDQATPASIYFTLHPLFNRSLLSDLNIHIVSMQKDLEQTIHLLTPSIIYLDATTIDLVDQQDINTYYMSGIGIAGIDVPLSRLTDLVHIPATVDDLKPLDKGFYISFLYKLQRNGANNFGQYTDHYMTLAGAHGGISEMINDARCTTWEVPNSTCK